MKVLHAICAYEDKMYFWSDSNSSRSVFSKFLMATLPDPFPSKNSWIACTSLPVKTRKIRFTFCSKSTTWTVMGWFSRKSWSRSWRRAWRKMGWSLVMNKFVSNYNYFLQFALFWAKGFATMVFVPLISLAIYPFIGRRINYGTVWGCGRGKTGCINVRGFESTVRKTWWAAGESVNQVP